MKVYLPNSAFLGNMDGSFLKQFDPSDPKKLHISANEKWISVHPVVLCMVAALGKTVPKSQITCDPLSAHSAHYAVRMGLFDFLGIDCGISITEHEPAGRFIPLTQIKTSEELTDFLKEIDPLLHLKPEQTKPIKYIVSELVRNVLEHAQAPHGAIVAAQYFKKSNTIRIGIADTGIGIRQSMAQSYPTKTDFDAICLALTPGITGTTRQEGGTEQNAGAGLFFIKSIAHVNKDFFLIYSGEGLYKLLGRTGERIRLVADPRRDRHTGGNQFPQWNGTVVGIDISLDQTAEFSALLEAIRNTYMQAVRERKKARYRKPIFV